MANVKKGHLRELLFRISVSLKGSHAALEIVGGMAFLAVRPDFIVRVVGLLT
jgi:uncharacterized membrane protein